MECICRFVSVFVNLYVRVDLFPICRSDFMLWGHLTAVGGFLFTLACRQGCSDVLISTFWFFSSCVSLFSGCPLGSVAGGELIRIMSERISVVVRLRTAD